MLMSHHTNVTRIKTVANTLKELNRAVVFVGGATVSLYTDKAAAEVRPTDDVDIIVELATYKDYAALEERLRSVGFINDVGSGVICRYKVKGVIVDIMPTVPEAIGFSNKWYPEGFAHAVPYHLDDTMSIQIFSLPYFIASKIEAFKGRGQNDYRFSTDFEDIVFVFENAPTIEDALVNAPENVKNYLKEEFKKWLDDPDFLEGLTVHLNYHTVNSQVSRIKSIMNSILFK